MPDLDDLNRMPATDLRLRLLGLTSSEVWAEALIAGRPYADIDALLDASDDLVTGLEGAQVDAALSGHPRIGERATGPDQESAARSAGEQAGMTQADAQTQQAMAQGNLAYEQRFGRIYLVAAAGRSAQDLLTLLHQRLDNDPDSEIDVVRQQLAKITRLRLADTWGSR